MKASYQKILFSKESSFIAKKLDLPNFDCEYHYHPEYELKYVIKSRGKRFIGDSVENFQEGDLVFVGPNIPHYWKNDPVYYKTNHKNVSAFLIMFSDTFLGNEFLSLPEMLPIKELLYKAEGGIFFPGANNSRIPIKLKQLMSSGGPLRIVMFLDLLFELSKAFSKPLIPEKYIAELKFVSNNDKSFTRLIKVHEYVINNFQNRIDIQNVAAIANLTNHAFCKYFKKSTKKTFMTFLNELRVCHSKKLLFESDLPIADICYASGFENISYFNRKFKEMTKMTPKEFRKDVGKYK